ncbi:hypothetical protein B0A52_09352 [Exophiala mesophila]|uniref:Aldehyde dehydrogenase domain-containing protein n=1 Tax=Exophiala mesophila TaxID=212818 RepID=A0A438MSJ2_EXOME|nr:hypothetical protein B0A52_09352 [Exophiala mesophila]
MEPEFQSLNPATGEVHKTFPPLTDEEAAQSIKTAHHAFQNDWRLRSIQQRGEVIYRVAQLMRERVESLAALVVLEMGKPIGQAKFEVDISAQILEYYVKHGAGFLAPKTIPDAPESAVSFEPLGVLLAIEPWNYPFYQVARVVGPHLIAGNVVIVKHAPSVPQCALAIEALFREAEAPAGVYTNVFATIAQVNGIIDDFRVRGVTLTGSEAAGRAVAERAGRNLKKVVLELGGSDPFVVLEDASISQAVQLATIGRLLQAGQSCAASKRLIVVGKERGQQVLDALKTSFAATVPGDPLDAATVLGPVFAERGLAKLLEQVDVAQMHGAKVVLGGKRMFGPGFFMEPTIITDISPQNPLFGEEVFGPVLLFFVVDSEAEAVHLANATEFGLGASIIATNVDHAKEVAAKIESGMVFINSIVYSGPEVPFGGVKNSGIGRELSDLGILEFVNAKLVRVGLSCLGLGDSETLSDLSLTVAAEGGQKL